MKLPDYKLKYSDSTSQAIFLLDIVENMECFDGHFDDHPVLPGVAQLTFAVKIAEKQFNFKSQFKGLEVVKFQQVITPPNRVSLELKYDAEKSKLYFKYYKEEQTFSSGRVLV